MRGAFGKPQGTVARVHIGQVIMSVRTKENHMASSIEALRRAKFKYPGRQKVRERSYISYLNNPNLAPLLPFLYSDRGDIHIRLILCEYHIVGEVVGVSKD